MLEEVAKTRKSLKTSRLVKETQVLESLTLDTLAVSAEEVSSESADKFSRFRQRHPQAAPDLLHLLEVYDRCDRVPHPRRRGVYGVIGALDALDFERVYEHIFGSQTQEPCERCNPAFFREKRLLEEFALR